MTATAVLAAVSTGLMGLSLLNAAEFSTYRGFQFGMPLTAAANHIGAKASDARTVHNRPAIIQELEWQPNGLRATQKADSIKDGRLAFYKNELYRIAVTYDRDRVEGMTQDDLIAAISTTYGVPTRPKVEIAYHSNFAEVAQVIARWENAEYSYNLVRSGYGDSFGLVMYSKRLDVLAGNAIAEAVRMDAKEAPARAIEETRKKQQDEKSALDQARSINAPNFQP